MTSTTDTREGAINDAFDDVARFVASARTEISVGAWTNARRDVKLAMDDLLTAYTLLVAAEING